MREIHANDLDLNILRDPSTRLPLLSEESKILSLVMNYLSLPYSVVEYGCGHKANLIIWKLVDLGIPHYAIMRGMVMEKDMSKKALREKDLKKRPHALIAENILYHKIDFNDPILITYLEDQNMVVDQEEKVVYAEQYILSNDKTLQFALARSHIFTILYFWDDKNNKIKEKVVDPTLNSDECFPVNHIRKYLHASESIIFAAPLFGSFKMRMPYLTANQQKNIIKFIDSNDLNSIDHQKHRKLVLHLNNGEAGGIGDPGEWSYSNNISTIDSAMYEYQKVITGEGDSTGDLFFQMIEAKESFNEELVISLLDKIESGANRLNSLNVIYKDAVNSERELEPLTFFLNTLSIHTALKEMIDEMSEGKSLEKLMTQEYIISLMEGISFRLRSRIDKLAKVSRSPNGVIDARAFSEGYNQACLATISMMNEAGMKVFIDKVGNIHGLLIDDSIAFEIEKDDTKLREIANKSICHCSHIDTVLDGGMYDGRLGVLSGIEIAHLLYDFHKYFDVPTIYPNTKRAVMVSVFVGEEMTFTGQNVSMPGSSAVAGHAKPEEIYKMFNSEGETYKDKLVEMLRFFKSMKNRKKIDLMNNWTGSKKDLVNFCYQPASFLSTNTYERHIEQGSELDRAKIPLSLVNTIMGIHQEDFIIEDPYAAKIALEINRKLRKAFIEKDDLRITVGIILPDQNSTKMQQVEYGMRWSLKGYKDHAGATKVMDRHDAGMGISRLTAEFLALVDKLNEENNLDIKPVIGGVEIEPGTNRNVIPDLARITLGLVNLPENFSQYKKILENELKSYAIRVLSFPVDKGGEGIFDSKMHEVSIVNIAHKITFSIDLRAKSKKLIEDSLKEIYRIIDETKNSYNFNLKKEVQQVLDNYQLSKSGQVLQLERSYGGSHNPLETELARDLLMGTILQLAVSMDFIKIETSDNINLYEMVKEKVPAEWKEKFPEFISGALHDTCNISRVSGEN